MSYRDEQLLDWLEGHDAVVVSRDQRNCVPWSIALDGQTLGIGMHLRHALEQALDMHDRLHDKAPPPAMPDDDADTR